MAIDPQTGQWYPDQPGQMEAALPVSEPDYQAELNAPQAQQPNDFFSRLAIQSGGQGPFGPMNVGHKTSTLEGLAALLAGFVNGKTVGAAHAMNQVEQQNQRARESAKALAQHRWNLRQRDEQGNIALRNALLTKQTVPGAADKITPYDAERQRLKALVEMGGKPPGATPEPAATTSTIEDQFRYTRAGNKWFDLSSYKSPKEHDLYRTLALKAGAYPAEGPIAERLNAGEETFRNLDDIEKFLRTKLPDTTDPMRTAAWAAEAQAKAITKSDPDLAAYNKNIADPAIRSIQALAGGSGSGFRLTQAEVNSQIKALPQITDNLPTAIRKLENIRRYLQNKERAFFTKDARIGASKPSTTPAASSGMSDDAAYQEYLRMKGGK